MKKCKKLLSLITAVIMLLSVCPVVSFAEDDILSYLTYEINDGEVTITDCDTSISGDVVIPDTIEGYPVTEIGEYAFGHCYSIENVIIPNTVTTIGSWAFIDCPYLESVFIPQSVTTIGNEPFESCTNLTSIEIPKSVTSIGYGLGVNCSSLLSFVVDADNKYYSSDENGVIYNKDKTVLLSYPAGKSETKYVIPESVKTIDYCAFWRCNNLECVIIGDNVTSIGSQAFYGCSSLRYISIADSVMSVGYGAFSSTAFYYDSSTWTDDGVLVCDNIILSMNKFSDTSYEIDENIRLVYEGAFRYCEGIITVNANNTHFVVDEFGALYSADKTQLIRFPRRSEQTEYTIADETLKIADSAFYKCDKIENIFIPDSVTSIGECAFEGCANLTSIEIPYGVTEIKANTFLECTHLKSVVIPEGVTSIGYWAFAQCTSLENIDLPESLTYIDYTAFGFCFSLESITIPSGVKMIPWSAFVGCLNLKEINFPDNLELITGAFDMCTALKSVDIPEGTEKVIEYSFAYCPFMEEVYIYDTDVVLGECSFGYMEMEVLTDYDTYMAALDLYINSYIENEMVDFDIDQYHSYLDDVKKIDGFVIHGYKGSTAEAYALENGFEFIELCEHNYISGVIKEPTVTEVGIKADVCEHCGDIINAEEIPMLENNGDVSDDTNNTETPDDSESEDNSSLNFIEIIMQFFQKIIDFLKSIFAF